ncbi:14079_t:CDS:2, partial [Ambispora leptoticha]
ETTVQTITRTSSKAGTTKVSTAAVPTGNSGETTVTTTNNPEVSSTVITITKTLGSGETTVQTITKTPKAGTTKISTATVPTGNSGETTVITKNNPEACTTVITITKTLGSGETTVQTITSTIKASTTGSEATTITKPNNPQASKTGESKGSEATAINKPNNPSERTFTATQLITNGTSQFGPLIEGAAVNEKGELYAVDFQYEVFQLGKAYPTQELFFRGENMSWFNSIRFLPSKNKNEQIALTGDVQQHRVLKLVKSGKRIRQSVFCEDKRMVQPNDLAVTTSGRVYLSGQRFTNDTKIGDGDLWLCDGKSTKAIRLGVFGRTNGIEVSPDEKYLYLSEAFNKNGIVISNKILRFKLDQETGMTIGKPDIFVDFAKLDQTQNIDIDGMRTDIRGNLYVTRNGGGEVKQFSPTGKLLATIKTSMRYVTNLEFGGQNGTDLYIVGKCECENPAGCVDVFKGFSSLKYFYFRRALQCCICWINSSKIPLMV